MPAGPATLPRPRQIVAVLHEHIALSKPAVHGRIGLQRPPIAVVRPAKAGPATYRTGLVLERLAVGQLQIAEDIAGWLGIVTIADCPRREPHRPIAVPGAPGLPLRLPFLRQVTRHRDRPAAGQRYLNRPAAIADPRPAKRTLCPRADLA